jgi:hypothetical protein
LPPNFDYAWFERDFDVYSWRAGHFLFLDLLEAKEYHERRERDRMNGIDLETYYNGEYIEADGWTSNHGSNGVPHSVQNGKLYKMSDEPALVSLNAAIDSFAEHMTRHVGVTFKVSFAQVRYIRGNDVPETGMGWHRDGRGNHMRNIIILLRDAVGSTMFLKDGVSVSCTPDARGSATYFPPNVKHSAPLTPQSGRLFVVVSVYVDAPWEDTLLRDDEIAAAESWLAV